MDFLRMVLAMATMVSLAYAHIHCHPTVNDQWACYGAFRSKQLTMFLPVGSHCELWVWSHGGYGFHTINIDTRSEGKYTIVYP